MTKNIRKFAKTVKPYSTNIFVEQIAGIEPANLPWQGSILPLNYVCKFHKIISAINRPWAWQGSALSTELLPQIYLRCLLTSN